MKRFTSRGVAYATLTLLSLSASTLLTGCFEKDGEKPTGGTCDTAVTVVSQNGALVLQKADNTFVVPTGANWTNFNAKAGDKLLVGYSTKKDCGTKTTTGSAVELGCISLNTTTTTTTGPN